MLKMYTRVKVETSKPQPQHKYGRLNNHPFVDDIAQECNEVHRVREECERMEDNMDDHISSRQHST